MQKNVKKIQCITQIYVFIVLRTYQSDIPARLRIHRQDLQRWTQYDMIARLVQ